MADKTANFLCQKFLTNECPFAACKNVHDASQEARDELAIKGLNRICYNYNYGTCKHTNCKFLHIEIKHKKQPVPNVRHDKVEAVLGNLKVNMLKLEELIANSEVPPEVIEMQMSLYDNIRQLNSTLEQNLTKITIE
jgi:hypothetical protein